MGCPPKQPKPTVFAGSACHNLSLSHFGTFGGGTRVIPCHCWHLCIRELLWNNELGHWWCHPTTANSAIFCILTFIIACRSPEKFFLVLSLSWLMMMPTFSASDETICLRSFAMCFFIYESMLWRNLRSFSFCFRIFFEAMWDRGRAAILSLIAVHPVPQGHFPRRFSSAPGPFSP